MNKCSKNKKPICAKSPHGTTYWALNGHYHREDGPAVISSDGAKFWYIKDKLHREDGPAAIWIDGAVEEYYLNNKKYTERAYWKELYKRGKITKEELFLKLL